MGVVAFRVVERLAEKKVRHCSCTQAAKHELHDACLQHLKRTNE
jgi:hypothetical protein